MTSKARTADSVLNKSLALLLAAGLCMAFPAHGQAQTSAYGTSSYSGVRSGGTASSGTSKGASTSQSSSQTSTSSSSQSSTTSPSKSSSQSSSQTSWSVAPTLTGGGAASISGVDPETGLAFALDGYYTPYGDDLKGGGFSVMLEGVWIGGRLTMAFFHGDMSVGEHDASSDMSYIAGDLYLRHALIENLFVYAGVGVAAINYEYDYTVKTTYRGRPSSYKVGGRASSDPMFTCYGGIRWRFFNPLYVFAEYRHDADTDLEFNKTEMTLEGGGRMVFGGGFMF